MPDRIVLSTSAAPRTVRGGVIVGASVMTAGEVKTHGVWADQVTLQTVKRCAESFGPTGVKVKMDHHTGFENIIGTLRNFRIEGIQLLGDLHLISTHPRYPSIIEIATTMPTSFGMSIAFSGARETIDNKVVLRCTELYSVDLVDSPAANPNGLFSTNTGSIQRRIEALESKIVAAAGRAHLDKLYQQKGINPQAGDMRVLLSRVGLLKMETAGLAIDVLHQEAEADPAVIELLCVQRDNEPDRRKKRELAEQVWQLAQMRIESMRQQIRAGTIKDPIAKHKFCQEIRALEARCRPKSIVLSRSGYTH